MSDRSVFVLPILSFIRFHKLIAGIVVISCSSLLLLSADDVFENAVIHHAGKFTSGFVAHGPALRLKYEHPDAKIRFPIHIDISPAVNTHLSFEQLGIEWPREVSRAFWPSKELQHAVKEKGVMMVARQNFFWSASFVECEKELSKRADEDGGIRKTVHRLMKIFHDRFWSKHENHQLSSYMIKVRSMHMHAIKLGYVYMMSVKFQIFVVDRCLLFVRHFPFQRTL